MSNPLGVESVESDIDFPNLKGTDESHDYVSSAEPDLLGTQTPSYPSPDASPLDFGFGNQNQASVSPDLLGDFNLVSSTVPENDNDDILSPVEDLTASLIPVQSQIAGSPLEVDPPSDHPLASPIGLPTPEQPQLVADSSDEPAQKKETPADLPTNFTDYGAPEPFSSGDEIPCRTAGTGECTMLDMWTACVPERVRSLLLWRNVPVSGAVFGSGLLLLFTMSWFSLLSLLGYWSLGLVTVSLSTKAYFYILTLLQKNLEQANLLEVYLSTDVCLPRQQLLTVFSTLLDQCEVTIRSCQQILLFTNPFNTFKFVVFAYFLTYIGACINALTLAIIVYMGLFTFPKVYDTHQTQIDEFVNQAWSQVDKVYQQLKEKVPFLKKKTS